MTRTRRLLVLVALLPGCAAGTPATAVGPRPAVFSHADLDRVLLRFVNSDGLVDYHALQAQRADLDRYVAELAASSPDSEPARFPTDADRLAYWINAYNASAMRIVVDHYPIASVNDVRGWFPLSLYPGAGFFLAQRVTLGRAATNLYQLENAVIRGRFAEPRIHFALNCASRGCPRLPRRAFEPSRLEEQLEHEARRFMAEPRNAFVDPGARTVRLSAIFTWYEDDFTGNGSLLDYVRRYAPAAAQAELAQAGDYAIEFVPYDWGLNDQR